MKKDFLTIDDIRREDIFDIFKIALKLKRKPFSDIFNQKVFLLLFFEHSARSRFSFQIGIEQMSGKTYFVDVSEVPDDFSMLSDLSNILERYADCLIVRMKPHISMARIADKLDKPVVNAQSELTHPCQALSDVFTILEKFKSLKELKLAYVGKAGNVCNSLLLACAKAGMNVSVACPADYRPDEKLVGIANDYARVMGTKVEILNDSKEAVRDANIVYTDRFFEQRGVPSKIRSAFMPDFQVNDYLMDLASSDALFMHPLPAHRGYEVTSDVIDGHRSIVFDQAENRLHVQKALLIKLLDMSQWPL